MLAKVVARVAAAKAAATAKASSACGGAHPHPPPPPPAHAPHAAAADASPPHTHTHPHTHPPAARASGPPAPAETDRGASRHGGRARISIDSASRASATSAASANGGKYARTEAAQHSAAVGFDADAEEDRSLLTCFMLHAADLSSALLTREGGARVANRFLRGEWRAHARRGPSHRTAPLLPPFRSRRVAAGLEAEFAAQAQAEAAAGLSCSVMLAGSAVAKARNEAAFITCASPPPHVAALR